MKGVVFNLLEQAVTDEHGADTWDDLIESAGVSGSYTSLGSYPDEELMALVGAASEATGTPPADVVRWFGRAMIPMFVERYPMLFEQHDDALSFVLGLNELIHPEVRKLYPGAITPEFVFDDSDPEVLRMEYQSPRRLCALADGLIAGTVDHYGGGVHVEHPSCRVRGDDACLFTLVRT